MVCALYLYRPLYIITAVGGNTALRIIYVYATMAFHLRSPISLASLTAPSIVGAVVTMPADQVPSTLRCTKRIPQAVYHSSHEGAVEM